jgi:cell division protein FtsB
LKIGKYLIIFLAFMTILIAFGNNGLVDNYILNEKLSIIKDDNSRIIAENQALRTEILLLRGDPKYIEKIARDELGMVRKGDIVYRFGDVAH